MRTGDEGGEKGAPRRERSAALLQNKLRGTQLVRHPVHTQRLEEGFKHRCAHAKRRPRSDT